MQEYKYLGGMKWRKDLKGKNNEVKLQIKLTSREELAMLGRYLHFPKVCDSYEVVSDSITLMCQFLKLCDLVNGLHSKERRNLTHILSFHFFFKFQLTCQNKNQKNSKQLMYVFSGRKLEPRIECKTIYGLCRGIINT